MDKAEEEAAIRPSLVWGREKGEATKNAPGPFSRLRPRTLFPLRNLLDQFYPQLNPKVDGSKLELENGYQFDFRANSDPYDFFHNSPIIKL